MRILICDTTYKRLERDKIPGGIENVSIRFTELLDASLYTPKTDFELSNGRIIHSETIPSFEWENLGVS